MNEGTNKMYGKSLKVLNLPESISVGELRSTFSNQKKNGGGPIKKIIIYSCDIDIYAVITFKEIEAVTAILNRGNTVRVLAYNLSVEPFLKAEKIECKFQTDLPASDAKEQIQSESLQEKESKNGVEFLDSRSELKSDDESLNLLASSKTPVNFNSNPEAKYLNLYSESKSERKLSNSVSEINTEIEVTIDNDVLRRTIKAAISDRQWSKKFYELYLEDININDYYSEQMVLDGLHKNLYITFEDEAVAEQFCYMQHGEDSNITKVTRATQNDFEIYGNRIFLFGHKIPSSERLKKLVKEVTKTEVKDIIQNQEQNAAVIIFDEKVCSEIARFTWELTNLNGLKLIAAPVIKENAVLVSGLNGIPKFLLQRYVKSKKHSGGGPLKSVEVIDDNHALVVFLNETDLDNFLQNGSHELESCKLNASIFHSCLQQSYLQKWISEEDKKGLKNNPADNLLTEIMISSKSTDHKSSELSTSKKTLESQKVDLPKFHKPADQLSSEPVISNEANENNSDIKRSRPNKSITEKELQLKSEEFFLLEKSKILQQMKQMHSDLQIILDFENSKVALRGDYPGSLANMEIEILKFCKNIQCISLNDLSQEVKKFLELENVREKLSSLLPHGFLKCSSGEIELFYMKSEDPKLLVSLLKKQMFVEKKQLSSESFNALQSIRGKTFLASIDINSDVKSFVNLDADSRNLVILGPKNESSDIDKAVNIFLDKNKFITEEFAFPEGKKNFASKHMKKEVNSLQQDSEIQLTSVNDGFLISGFADDVREYIARLQKLSDNICRGLVPLKFDGIYEFMRDPKGQTILQEIQVKNNCVIILNNEASQSLQDRPAVERASSRESIEESIVEKEERLKEVKKLSEVKVNFGKIQVILEEGEIDKQKTDIIVVSVDRSLDLKKRKISKILLEKAGENIQKELNSKYRGINPGEIAVTSGGLLPCHHIIFACISPLKSTADQYEYKTSLTNLKEIIIQILREAYIRSAKTISLPSLGTGHLGYSADASANMMIDAISEYASRCSYSTLERVNLVVYPADKEVLKAFQNVVSSKGKVPVSPTDKRVKFAKKDTNLQYGNIQLVIEQGDITKEQCDAIVISIRESMNLFISGKVCKALYDACGSNLQQECYKKKDEIKELGVVMTSSYGLKCKKIFFISQDKFATHWDDGIFQVLKNADKAGIKSIALPALGAGLRQADLQEIKKSMLTVVEKFSRSKVKGLNLIKIIIFDKKMLDVFLETDQEVKFPTDDKQKDAKLVMKKLSKKVVLDVYSDDVKKIAATKSDLEDMCQNNFEETTIEDDRINLLKKNYIEDLKSFGFMHEIRVSFFLNENKMTAKGFNQEGIQEVEMKLKALLSTVETKRGAKVNSKEPSILWYYKKQDHWHKFEPLLNCDLEQAFQKKSSNHTITDVKGESYFIDFHQMKQFTMDCYGTRLNQFCDIRRDCKQNTGQLKEEIDKKTESKVPAAPLKTEKGTNHSSKGPTFVWERNIGQQWCSFEPKLNSWLEEEFQKRNIYFTFTELGFHTFEVDFTKMIIYPVVGMDRLVNQYSLIRRIFIAKN